MDIKNLAYANFITPEQTPQDSPVAPSSQTLAKGIHELVDTTEQQPPPNFLDVVNNFDVPSNEDSSKPMQLSPAMTKAEVGITDPNFAQSASDKFYELISKISALIDSLPADLRDKMKSDFNDLVNNLNNLISEATKSDPENQAIMMRDKWNHAMFPGLDPLGSQGPSTKTIIPDTVWTQLNQFLEQIQGLLSPAQPAEPNPNP